MEPETSFSKKQTNQIQNVKKSKVKKINIRIIDAKRFKSSRLCKETIHYFVNTNVLIDHYFVKEYHIKVLKIAACNVVIDVPLNINVLELTECTVIVSSTIVCKKLALRGCIVVISNYIRTNLFYDGSNKILQTDDLKIDHNIRTVRFLTVISNCGSYCSTRNNYT